MRSLRITQEDIPWILQSTPQSLPTVVPPGPNEKLLGKWYLVKVSGLREPFHGVLALTSHCLLTLQIDKQAESVGLLGPKGIRFTWTLVDSNRLEDIAHLSAPSALELMVDGRVHFIGSGDPYCLNSIGAAREARIARLGLSGSSTASQGSTTTREVHREIVKVACRFCGALTVQTERKCSGCGAPLFA